MTNESTTNELLRNAYVHFNARNIDAALALMSPAVIWPNGMEGGTVEGHNAIREYWSRQWTLIDPTVEPLAISRAPDDHYRVEVHQLVRDLEGNVLSDRILHHTYRLHGGLIESMEIQE